MKSNFIDILHGMYDVHLFWALSFQMNQEN